MSDPLVPRVGGVLSADIAVPEHEREMRFYSRVLTTGEDPLWREDLMNNLGTPIVGLGPRSAEYDHLPLQWTPHIQVADVAASVKRALELGGRELILNGESQWAVLLDPNGAAFGVVPVVSEDAVPPMGGGTARVGHLSGLDLTVADASATGDFYRRVVDWSVREVETEDASGRYADCIMIGADGNPAAAVRHARGVHADLPPVWMIHLPVGDLAESLRRVPEEGGKIIKATRGGEDEYTCAVVQDPVGAYLALVSG